MNNRSFIQITSWCFLIGCLLIAIWISRLSPETAQQISSTPELANTKNVSTRSGFLLDDEGFATQPIETIRVGDRVTAFNPSIEKTQRTLFQSEPDWKTWRHITCTYENTNGNRTEINMLRPSDWILDRELEAGDEIDIDLPRMGITGFALVESIRPAPKISSSSGSVVTATFRHRVDELIEVILEGEVSPIHSTKQHPFWNHEKREFQPIEEIPIGGTISDVYGVARRVIDKKMIASTQHVYNIETFGEHVYFVGSQGFLVHNECTFGSFTDARAFMSDFRQWAKTQNLNKQEYKHVLGMIREAKKFGSDIRPDNFIKEVAGITTAISRMHSKGYRMITENFGYGPSQRWGVDLVFSRQLKGKPMEFATVEAKGYRSTKDVADLSQGSQQWTLNRANRAANNNPYARELADQINQGKVRFFISHLNRMQEYR